MTASLLPNGEIQFTNEDGTPVAAGWLYTYVPATTTFKTSWQDEAQTILNLNPIPLDAGGRCYLYGSGQYRLLVKDATGDTVQDMVTTDTLAATGKIPYGVDSGAANGIVVATTNPSIDALNAGQTLAVMINHDSTGATTLALGSFGTYAAVTPDAQVFSKGDVVSSTIAYFVFTGTAWQLLGLNNGLVVFNCGFRNSGVSSGGLSPLVPAVACKRVATGAGPNLAIGAVQGATGTDAAAVEIALNVGLQSKNGAGNSSHEAVSFYSGLDVQVGSGSAWNTDLITAIEAGATANAVSAGSPAFITGLAININNLDRDLPITLVNGGSTGLTLSGVSTARSTFGMLMVGSNLYHVGIDIGAGFASDYGILEASGATRGIACFGGAAQAYKIDCSPASTAFGTSAYDIRLANAKGIVGAHASGSSDRSMLSQDVGDFLRLGANNSQGNVSENHFFPATDNTFACGISGGRWTEIWAVNGTIQTSDPSLKTDIAALPKALPVVLGVDPIQFRWIDGGFDLVEEQVEVLEPVLVPQSRLEWQNILQENGSVMRVEVKIDEMVQLLDEIQVQDALGRPIFHVMRAQRTLVRSAEGVLEEKEVLRPVETTVWEQGAIPMLHSTPRMHKVWAKKLVPKSHPGRRVHFGFKASDIKAALIDQGQDCGAYVRGSDGTENLRPDQLIPILWKAVQELTAQVEELKRDRS